MLFLIVCALLVAWGAWWGFVRDQDGPQQGGSGSGNPWKEIGVGVLGLPLAILIAVQFGLTLDALLAGTAAWLLTAGAWSLRHAVTSYVTGRPERAISAQNAEDMVNLALGGALVTLGPALALVWFGHPYLAGLALLAGAAKAGTYKLAWIVRPVPGKRPEATFLGHVLHGALAMGGAGACVLAAG